MLHLNFSILVFSNIFTQASVFQKVSKMSHLKLQFPPIKIDMSGDTV